ncbi:hypothetical protein [Celerinatantimonas diazotrophica]|nr:hypothetical protein [Celerinatantimonas diazotrophica]
MASVNVASIEQMQRNNLWQEDAIARLKSASIRACCHPMSGDLY